VLAGEQTLDEIVLNDVGWYTEHGITLHAGWTVTSVDRVKRMVHAAKTPAARPPALSTTACCCAPAPTPSCCRCLARTWKA
jgi:hypothetical protein